MTLRYCLPLIAALASVGCSLQSPHPEAVKTSAAAGTAPITFMCVKLNPDLAAPEFVDELRHGLAERHIDTLVYSDTPPSQCHYHMLYWTDWRFENRLNLYQAILRVYEGDNKIGEAVYDAPQNTPLSFQKDTATKLAGMLDQLFPKRG